MDFVKLIQKAIQTPGRVPMNIIYRIPIISHNIPDEAYLKFLYFCCFGKKMNLDNPRTFSEKLQWLKLHDRRPEYTTMVDKYEVKKYVADKIGEEYVIPTLGVWDDFEEIDFGNLPNQFVLKCTHDSGGLVICKDKSQLDVVKAKKKINKCLKRNFYWMGREWPYKNVKPRIIAEQYMEDNATGELRDYTFFAFDSVVKALFVASDRQNSNEETKFDFYNSEFKHLNVKQGHPNAIIPPSKPETFEKMKSLAEKLSEGIPQVRVDFYEVNGRTYFGELTFAHFSGFVPFSPKEWDARFGKYIKLPETCGGYLIIADGFVLYIHETMSELLDYKVMCFNGKVKYTYVCSNRYGEEGLKINFYDRNWDPSDIERANHKKNPAEIDKPVCYETMIRCAETLAEGIPFVRVDFYQCNDRLYFGEMTFFPTSGFVAFAPENADQRLGKILDINS